MARYFPATIFFLLSFFSSLASPLAGSGTYFKTMKATDGLPDNSVNAIAQDSKGFIWAATWNGLARHDGMHTRIFRNNPADTTSLVNNMVRSLLPVDNGIIIATDNGLCFYSFSRGTFHRMPMMKASSPVEHRMNRIIRTGTLIYAMDVHGSVFRIICGDADGIPYYIKIHDFKKEKFADIAPLRNGKMLAVSNKGLSIFDRDGTSRIAFHPSEITTDNATNLHCDTISGRIFVGRGIGHSSMAFRTSPDNTVIEDDSGSFVPDNLMDMTVRNGVIYFATDGDGVAMEDIDGKVTYYTPVNSSIPSDAIYSLFTDRDDNLWIGTYRHGIALLSDMLNHFSFLTVSQGSLSHNIVTAAKAYGDRIVFGLDGGGIDIFNPASMSHRNISKAGSILPSNNVVSVDTDGKYIWAAVYTVGLVKTDPESGAVTIFPLPWEMEPDNKVWVAKDDGNGSVWVGGLNLNILDKATGKYTAVEELKGKNVTSIARQGRYFWVATRYSGFYKIDMFTRKVMFSSSASPLPGIQGNNIDFIFCDSKGTLWINVYKGNVYAIDSHTMSVKRQFGKKDGLSNSSLMSAIEDTQGFIWLGTLNGLFRFNPEYETFVKMRDPRLPSYFTAGAAESFGQSLVFGTTEGAVIFNPSTTLARKENRPDLVFTELYIQGKEDRPIPIYSSSPGDVSLRHDDNFFSVNFALPELVYPGEVEYSYRLRGLDNDWSQASSDIHADYTNVPPGHYTFELRNSRSDGSWSEPIHFNLNITPPWYKTWWATIIWVILLIAALLAIVLVWRDRMNARHKANILRIETESEKKLNDAKIDFYTKITHQLRTPLFLITAQTEEMLNRPETTLTVRKSVFEDLYRHERKLNKLINNLINSRKLEAGVLSPEFRTGDLTQFLQDFAKDSTALCRMKKIDFRFEHDPKHIVMPFDPDVVDLILGNLISNAFKYTREYGKIVLSLTSDSSGISISVKDNGIGITEPMHDKIFNPYFRTERGKQEGSGDGLGLAFVKELVELHGGSISLSSKEGKGSEFVVRFPPASIPAETEPGSQPAAVREADTQAPARLPGKSTPKPEVNVPSNLTSNHFILIVDNNADMLQVLSDSLSQHYGIMTADSIEKAMAMAEESRPDILLTDIAVESHDGDDIVKAFRRNPAFNEMLIVVLSSLTAEEDMLRAFDEGADAYFTRPVSMKLLKRNIDKLLEKGDMKGQSHYTRQEQMFLSKLKGIIEENLFNPEFSIEFMAQKMAMSHSTLYKRLKGITGLTLIDFINDYRVSKAVALFRQGNNNVQKVGEMCGFRDGKTFRDAFKRKTGLPPKQFLQNLR